jgi:hypothetical protein
MTCKICGRENPTTAKFCQYCGQVAQAATGAAPSGFQPGAVAGRVSDSVLPAKTSKPGLGIKVLAIAAGLVVFVIVAVFALLVYIGSEGPSTSVVPGRQIPKEYRSTIQTLDLLEEGEQILYFYSDAMVDIEEGFYLLTDRKVAVYDNEWDPPDVRIPFSQIEDLDITYDESFWTDSTVLLVLTDGSEVWFPLSSDDGGDKKFFEALERLRKENR